MTSLRTLYRPFKDRWARDGVIPLVLAGMLSEHELRRGRLVEHCCVRTLFENQRQPSRARQLWVEPKFCPVDTLYGDAITQQSLTQRLCARELSRVQQLAIDAPQRQPRRETPARLVIKSEVIGFSKPTLFAFCILLHARNLGLS